MQSAPKVTQEWSLHAEVTFSHGSRQPLSSTQNSANNVSMEYSWQNPSSTTTTKTTVRPCYGFQRGNIFFTTNPPRPSSASGSEVSQDKSKQSPQKPYNRRCKSTCNIVLTNPGDPPQSFHYHCADRASYYAGVPGKAEYSAGVLDQGEYSAGLPGKAKYSASPLNCEVCSGSCSETLFCHGAKNNTFTTHFCTRVPERTVNKERQDAASQTDSKYGIEPEHLQVSAPVQQQKNKTQKRLARSPARVSGRSPLLYGKQSQGSQCTDSRASTPSSRGLQLPNQGKPRTVHIDVYCTGSEDADASASSECDTTDESSPQTVFESEQLRVMHTRMGKNCLPKGLIQTPIRSESLKEKPSSQHHLVSKGYESDDGLSCQYPSRFSSYSSLRETDSILQSSVMGASRDPSWSTISTCAPSEDNDSVTATSWKDTVTEVDSLNMSSPSVLDKFDAYLTQSDSFEYADLSDRIRIREKAMTWAEENMTWQSPGTERKHLLQQQKFKEFLHKHLGKGTFPLWKSLHTDDSDEDDDDDTGDAWSFIGRGCSGHSTLQREDTVKRAGKSTPEHVNTDNKSLTLPSRISRTVCDTGSLSDSGPPYLNRFARRVAIGPFGTKPPSPPMVKVESSVVSPFTSALGTGTEQLSKAQKFGTIVGALKKPGHHIGPSKNPDCSCVHCRSFYARAMQRERAKSVGVLTAYSETVENDRIFSQNVVDREIYDTKKVDKGVETCEASDCDVCSDNELFSDSAV